MAIVKLPEDPLKNDPHRGTTGVERRLWVLSCMGGAWTELETTDLPFLFLSHIDPGVVSRVFVVLPGDDSAAVARELASSKLRWGFVDVFNFGLMLHEVPEGYCLQCKDVGLDTVARITRSWFRQFRSAA